MITVSDAIIVLQSVKIISTTSILLSERPPKISMNSGYLMGWLLVQECSENQMNKLIFIITDMVVLFNVYVTEK